MRRLGAIRDGVHHQQQPRDTRRRAPPIHLDAHIPGLLKVSRDRNQADHQPCHTNKRANPEIPPPRHDLVRQPAHKDPNKEAHRAKCPVHAKHEVLPRARPVHSAKEHDPCRQERRGAEADHCAAKDEHCVVAAEPCNEGPDGEPEVAEIEEGIAAVYVSKAAEGKEKGTRNKGEDARGPGARGVRNVEGDCEGREDGVKAGDEVVLELLRLGSTFLRKYSVSYSHEAGNQDGEAEANFLPGRREGGWPFPTKLLDVFLGRKHSYFDFDSVGLEVLRFSYSIHDGYLN